MGHLNPGTGLTIRKMEQRDLERVLSIASALPMAPHWPRSAYDEVLAPGASGLRRIALVGEVQCELVGFVVARVVAPQAEIESIAIAKAAQGYGFGSALLHAILGELELAGVLEVELELRASNMWANFLYARAGFLEVGRRSAYYADPVEDAVLMRLPVLDGLSTV